MIEDKKRKTRRVSKKVKKMHEEGVSKGILGATPAERQKGGNGMDIYKIDVKNGDEVISSELKNFIQLKFISLDDLLNKLESGHTIRIEKSDRFGRETTRIYKFKEV